MSDREDDRRDADVPMRDAEPEERGRSASRSPVRAAAVAADRSGERKRSPVRERKRSPSRERKRSPSRERRRRIPSRSRSRDPPRRRSRSRSRDQRRRRSPSRSRSRDRRRRSPSRDRGARRSPPPRRERSPPPAAGTQLFVAGIPFMQTERDLGDKFDRYGRVKEVRIVRNNFTGESKGFGFVEMENEEAAAAAIRKLDGTDWNGRRLLVEVAKRPR